MAGSMFDVQVSMFGVLRVRSFLPFVPLCEALWKRAAYRSLAAGIVGGTAGAGASGTPKSVEVTGMVRAVLR